MKVVSVILSSVLLGASQAIDLENCSYIQVDEGLNAIGIGPCYTHYNATSDTYFSFNYSCDDDDGVYASYYLEDGCYGNDTLNREYVPFNDTDFFAINCGGNENCATGWTQYTNTNASSCDFDTASYEQYSVVTDQCISNGTHSVIYGCFYGYPTRRQWSNVACSGSYDFFGQADGCDCDDYDNECSIVVLDGLECNPGEGTIYGNCSYAIADSYFPFILDQCYNRREDGYDYSVYFECIDQWSIQGVAHEGRNCNGNVTFNETLYVWDLDWDIAHCGSNNDACTDNELFFREYETNHSTCSTLEDDFESFGIYTDFCLTNGSNSVKFGCVDDDGPAQQMWINSLNCSGGEADRYGYPDEDCDCDMYGGCSLTVIYDNCEEEEDAFANCSFAITEDGLPLGLDVCYNRRENGIESSVMGICRDSYTVTVMGWNVTDCYGDAMYVANVSIYDLGWESAHCAEGEIDYDCVGYYTEYETPNSSNMSYCDTNSDDYMVYSIVTDYCIPMSNYSVKFGCVDGDREAQQAYDNLNCSGDPIFIGYPRPGCRCWDDGCQLLDINICDDDDDEFANCSYAIIDGYTPIGLDTCYNRRDGNGSFYEWSIYVECIDSYNIRLLAYNGSDCDSSEYSVFFNESTSIYAFDDWTIAHCAVGEPDDSCLGYYTEYTSDYNTSYCDTWTDSYEQFSVVLDLCVTNWNYTRSVMFGCYDDYGESQQLYMNGNCSGEPFEVGTPTEYCECDEWDGTCSLTVIDIDCDENIPFENCSYINWDGLTSRGLDICYGSYMAGSGDANSYQLNCVDKYHVEYNGYLGRADCSGPANFSVNVSASFLGARWANCGDNTDCLARFTTYENNITYGECDTSMASYEDGSVVFNACFGNENGSSVIYDCGDDGYTPTMNIFNNTDCSGDPIETGSAGNCSCYDNECQITIVDVCSEDVVTTTEMATTEMATTFLPTGSSDGAVELLCCKSLSLAILFPILAFFAR